jgi:hypothetical protein
MWDVVMDKSGAEAGFLRELRFPLPIYIPSASPLFTITQGWHNGPGVAAVPIASQTRIKKKKIYRPSDSRENHPILREKKTDCSFMTYYIIYVHCYSQQLLL